MKPGKRTLLLWFSVTMLAGWPVLAKAPGHAAEYRRFAVASDVAAASEAGAEVLHKGGNAADAAAATMLALGVVNPASSGLGGGGFALYYDAASGKTTFLDFRERAPAAATRTMYADDRHVGEGPANSASQIGGLASGVPGEPAGIEMLVRRFGKLDLKSVVEPALNLARKGTPVTQHLEAYLGAFGAQLASDPAMSTWPALKAGDLLYRPRLADVLSAFAEEGARAIYHGQRATRLVRDVQARGGILSEQDLRDYRVVERKPLRATYFGFDWVTAPPPSAGGFTLLQSLDVLERALSKSKFDDALRTHLMVESWKGPFADRQRYFGDPDQVILPLEQLLDPSRAKARADRIDPHQATAAAEFALPLERNTRQVHTPDNAGTSHLCVVDEHGNVAAVTTTVNLPFGARYTAAGIVMNDEMDDFASAVGVQNAFGLVGGRLNLPGSRKRPISTMTPTIVFRDGKPVLCVGGAGGSRIVTATQQVAMRVLLDGMPVGAAVAAPRVHHQGTPDELETEQFAPPNAATEASLRQRGHVLSPRHHLAIVQAIEIVYNEAGRLLRAASDPRKGGRPAGE